jgi:hypothetical protein
MEKDAQYFALDQWLSDYPDDMTYDEVIQLLRLDAWSDKEPDRDWMEVITPWYLIEGHVGEQIADFIEDTYSAALRLLERK